MDELEPGNSKGAMIADWLAGQRREGGSVCHPDTTSAPRSDGLEPLQPFQQEDLMLKRRHSLGPLRPDVAQVDGTGQLRGVGSWPEDDRDEDALPEGRNVDFLLQSNCSSPRRDAGNATPQITNERSDGRY